VTRITPWWDARTGRAGRGSACIDRPFMEENVRRHGLWSLCCALVVLALCPAAALAGGTNLTVKISGAGTVKEIDGEETRVDCSNTGGEKDCDSVYVPTNTKITLKATPATGWIFKGWTEDGPDKFGCAGTGTCSFTAPICVLCATNAKEVANFDRADADGDGFKTDLDCDDSDAGISPDATEIPDNDVDENCDRIKAYTTDKDGDGYDKQGVPGSEPPYDCNDNNAGINPAANEILDNEVDENCDGTKARTLDIDHDGFVPPEDCNEGNASINPAAHEVPDNNVDENCDTTKAFTTDKDGDGYDKEGVPGAKAPYDCNDNADGIHPGAVDVAENGVDEDCSGADRQDLDKDRDGYERPYDCNDANAGIHPGALDLPRNGIDENCDGRDEDWKAMPVGVEHGFQRVKGGVKLALLLVKRLPAGANVTVSCNGKDCPRKAIQRKVQLDEDVIALHKRFRKAVFRRKATVTVRITHGQLLGKSVQLALSRRKPVQVAVACLAPATGATVSC
jgi:hypothetical protein